MAFCASCSEPIVTKAKPRDLPVNLSCMRVTSCTAPACVKSSCSSFSVVLKERLPTYNLVPIEFILENELQDRKSTRLNSSHVSISYAVFCLKKKKKKKK